MRLEPKNRAESTDRVPAVPGKSRFLACPTQPVPGFAAFLNASARRREARARLDNLVEERDSARHSDIDLCGIIDARTSVWRDVPGGRRELLASAGRTAYQQVSFFSDPRPP